MKFPIFLTLFSLFFITACKTETPINGEIFVVTKGVGNYKLGAIQVAAISEKDLNSQLLSEANSYKTAVDTFQLCIDNAACMNESDKKRHLLSDFLFRIPARAITTTNGDGKFSLKLPSGSYYLLARGQRSIGLSDDYPSTEYYLWLQKVTASGKEQTVILSNNNLIDHFQLQAMMNLAK